MDICKIIFKVERIALGNRLYMKDKKLKIVITGHVDHGKSTVIGRLLLDSGSLSEDRIKEIEKIAKDSKEIVNYAFLLDHLKEEREKGITIDTTQAYLKKDGKEYVLIDAPGHVEFITNMITGSAQADAAILVLDASEGICEQTKRHSFILSMLGITQLILVINKMDTVDYSEAVYRQLKKEILGHLASFHLEVVHTIPVSAIKGENIVTKSPELSFYQGPTVWEALEDLHCKNVEEANVTIVPIQDVYEVDSKKLYIGRIETGKASTGCQLFLPAKGKEINIKQIMKFQESRDEYEAGDSVGLLIDESLHLERGDILCTPGTEISPVLNLRATILWLSHYKLSIGEKFTLHCLTQEADCYINKIYRKMDSSDLSIIEDDSTQINDLEVCDVDIVLESPLIVSNRKDLSMISKIVLVKNNNICGNGIVINC